MSGIYGRALNATSPGEAQRHGTNSGAAFFHTLSREFLMLIPMGRSDDIRLALRRRQQREMKDKKSNVANFLEAQWVRGKALPRGSRGVEEGTERLRPSIECYSERRQRCDVLRTMRDVQESVAAHSPDLGGTGPRDETKQWHTACVYREATGRNRTPFVRTDTGA